MQKFCETALEHANPYDVCNFCENYRCKWKNQDENPKYIGNHYTSKNDKTEVTQ